VKKKVDTLQGSKKEEKTTNIRHSIPEKHQRRGKKARKKRKRCDKLELGNTGVNTRRGDGGKGVLNGYRSSKGRSSRKNQRTSGRKARKSHFARVKKRGLEQPKPEYSKKYEEIGKRKEKKGVLQRPERGAGSTR